MTLLREIPHPSPNNPIHFGSYLISWQPPLFTGGLTQLQYNVIVRSLFGTSPPLTSTNLTSAVVHLEDWETSRIIVSVVSRTSTTQQVGENGPHFDMTPTSVCAGKGNYILLKAYLHTLNHYSSILYYSHIESLLLSSVSTYANSHLHAGSCELVLGVRI